jgi:predicted Zn finger-like uncharacterized protein/prepilin-type processing-associated H-X9-DG protein
MADTTTQCPHCGFAYTVTAAQAAAMAGQSFACTSCGRPFTLAPSGGAFAQPAQQAAAVGYPAGVTYASGAHVRSNPLAIASLICGCFLCLPLVPGIAAIITGTLGMRRARDPAVTGKGMAIAGLTLGILNVVLWCAYFGLIFAIMVPSMGMARQTANQVKCSSNLRQIGLALITYANQNRGAFPDTIEELVAVPGRGLTSAVYDCPTTPRAPPRTNSPQALSGKIEYTYVAKGLLNTASPTTVLAYEPVANHGTGCNVLYADGTVTFMVEPHASRIIQQVTAGQNPPRLVGAGAPTTLPAEVEQ